MIGGMLSVVIVPFLIMAAISITLSAAAYVAAQLLKPKGKTPLTDTRPSTQVERGSFVPLLMGRRRVGAVVGYVGDRRVFYTGKGGARGIGKGLGGQHGHDHSNQTPVYAEKAFHLLAIGPVSKLHAVYSNGTKLFTGPIDPLGYPTGSVIQVTEFGNMQIFWGDSNQNILGSVNTFLGDASRIGITSCWPGICYIIWDLRLGSAPQWPIIEYDIETEVQPGSVLTGDSFVTTTDAAPLTGPNPGFLIAQLLFGAAPFGASLDPALFDLPSLQAVADVAAADGFAASTLVQQGDEILAVVGNLLQDLGCLMAWDPVHAKYKFNVVRESGVVYASPIVQSNNALYDIGDKLLMEPKPEIESVKSTQVMDKVVYTFTDIVREYRPNTVVIDEDGQASAAQIAKASKQEITNTISFTAATVIAERRSQEVMAAGSHYTINACRDARTLLPGQAFTCYGIPEVLRVVEISFDADSGVTKIVALSDFYSTKTATYLTPVATGGMSSSVPITPSADVFEVIEVPEYLLPALGGVSLATPRFRADANTSYSDVHLSRDDVTYTQEGRETRHQTGGVLLAGLPIGSYYVAQGPTFTATGPDIADALDLSADLAAWRAGKQLLAIGDELFFCQKITAMGGSTYRFDGLLRARFDTVQAVHSIGDNAFLFVDGGVLNTEDPLILVPAATVYVKEQPTAGSVPFSLASVTPVSRVLYGKGIVPPPPCALRIAGGALQIGVDAVFRWGWGTAEAPGSGAGMQGAGDAAGHAPTPDFELRVYDGVTLKATIPVPAAATYTYSAADRIADLGSDMTFTLKVYQIRNGLYSSPFVRTFTAT